MALFQQSVIKQYISSLDENKLQQGWNHFQSYFKDNAQQKKITESKEEQFQFPFLDNLFDKCLGYTIDGSEQNLFTEFKNVTDSKKADGAIKINDDVVAVIELKSTKTKDFNKIQEQAFGYQVSHPNCKYVVTSNFNRLRFYIENATAFEEFDLFNLTYERFKLLWLCLSFESVSSGIPLKIKSESTLNEENITKKLYKDYSLFRKEIFNDIVEKNQQYDKLTLFNKTQKLLDRFLFIFFAEDRRLLPVNSISKIIEKWEDDIAYGDEKSLYTSFKLYFNLLNKGRPASVKREEIFAYNGGLFAPDEILNSISIDDKLLSKHTKNLSTYDFESDVSVNILGHIFEHSLSEIEEIQNEITGIEADKTSSKRKKDGVFYTPSYITKYIVENTVGKLCQEKKEELEINEEVYTQRKARSKKRIDNLDAYRNWLLGITICDPACGSGAFLVQALDFLIEEHKYIDELNAAYHGASIPFSDITSSILENNLYGVDINGESVEIAKLSLWLRTAQKGRKLTSLNSNLKCGNSLIDDPEVAGDKAFNWENEFPEVFANGGFDVVIGNPPYLRKQGLMEHYPEMCEYYEENFTSSTGNYDIYTLFMEKSFSLINQNGVVSFILPHKFLISDFGKGIRQFFVDNKAVSELIHFGSEMVFQDATTYTCIINLTKNDKQILKFNHLKPIELFNGIEYSDLPYSRFSKEQWILTENSVNKVLEKINYQPLKLKDIFVRFVQGIITGKDAVFCVKGELSGEFLNFTDEEGIEHNIEKGILKPHLRGEDVNKFKSLRNNEWLIFPYHIFDEKAELITFSELKSKYPNTLNYLKGYENILREREKGKFNNDYWYQYSRNQAINVLEQKKIITPEFCYGGSMTLDESNFYHNSKCHSLLLKENTGFTYKSILPLINSSLFWFYLSNTGNVLRGGYIGVKRKVLEPFSIPKPDSVEIDDLESYTDLMLDTKRKHQSFSNTFIKYFKSKYRLQKLSKKLQKWYDLDFFEFISEINKSLKKGGGDNLTKKDEIQWMELFETKKDEAKNLKDKIDKTDREIDQMVYELYGLTQEEIEIVENATK